MFRHLSATDKARAVAKLEEYWKTLCYPQSYKIQSLLQDGSYSTFPRDTTSRIVSKITTLLRLGDFPTDVLKRLIPKNCKPPRICGLPKIRKNNCLLRPIVSTLESPIYNTAQYLARVLREYTGKTSHFV